MAYKINRINVEEAKKRTLDFQYALIYMISEMMLKKTTELDEIHWEECEEARFFSKEGEIHFFQEDGELQAVELVDDPCEDEMDSMQKKYKLASKFQGIGKYVLVKEYLKYDEDGQVQVVQTRLMGIE